MTLNAKPWLVTQREMRTPIAASFSLADPHAGEPGHAAGARSRIRSTARISTVFEIADVAMHVAAIGLEIEDRIADELARAVIRHVAAAAGLEDARRRARAASTSEATMCDAVVARLHAERDDWGCSSRSS